MIDTKSRILAVAGALALLLVVIDLVRRRKLKEEYSVLWVAAGVALLILAIWYQLLGWITTAIGGVALSTTLFFFALLFVFCVLLHYSVRISALERRLTALVQEVGIAGVRPVHRLAGADGPMPPRVAVVIPCHDDGIVVKEAVASAAAQDETPEIVVVDDGSTDPATLAALEELSGQVTVLRQDNAGPGAARTAGLRHSSAPYVFVLDADDRLAPGALADMVRRLEQVPSAGFTWGDYELFGGQRGSYRSPDEWLPWTLTYVNPYPVCSLFRREALERAGGWMARGYEDWDLWLTLADLGISGTRTDRVVYERRLHGRGRRIADLRAQHQAHFARLQERHPRLFSGRGELRRRERPAVWKPLVYPVLFGPRKVVPMRVEIALQRLMMRLGIGLPG